MLANQTDAGRGAQLSSRRQDERRRATTTSACARTRSAISSTPARWRWARPESLTTTPATLASRASSAAQRNRAPTVYVGANDGMLHAFNDPTGCLAALDPACADVKETWAYIPRVLFSGGDPNDTAHNPDPMFQLAALSFNSGVTIGTESAKHRFYVNATPRIWDIDFANTNTSTPPPSGNDWRTMLVGGLGAGGRAVYALDVTNPVALPPPAVSTDTEASVASKVLWEFTEANLGYVFDAPTLVKTRALWLGSAGCIRIQQSWRQGLPLCPRPDDGSARASDVRQDSAPRRHRVRRHTNAAFPPSARSRTAARIRTCCRPTAAISKATSGVSTSPARL